MMAGDWIKMRADLFTHPKVVRIASAHRTDTLRAVGALMSVWCLFDAHSEDGRLDGYTPETLDMHLRWPGFSESMIGVGWLEFDGESLVLPRFDAHNGQSAKRRAQEADRKREARKSSADEADTKRTREEKRREEVVVTGVTTPPAPEGLDLRAWDRWADYRKKIRKPIKPASMQPAMAALAKHGANQAAVVEQSIANGWQGLFDLKAAGQQRRMPTAENFAEKTYEGGLL